MTTKLMLGVLAIVTGVYVFNESGLNDPTKTLLGTVFILLAAAIWIPDVEENKGNENDE